MTRNHFHNPLKGKAGKLLARLITLHPLWTFLGLLIIVFLASWFNSGRAQLPCNVHRDSATRSITSNSSNISISCSVGIQNVLEQPSQVLWMWVELRQDGRSIKTHLGSGTVSGKV